MTNSMRLTVWLPTQVLMQEEVTRIKAEAENGWFGLLPKHVDFVTALVPGILAFEVASTKTLTTEDTEEHRSESGSGRSGGLVASTEKAKTFTTEDTEEHRGITGSGRNQEREEYLAIDYGILVKCGREVSISTRAAVHSADLEQLRKDVRALFQAQEDREKKAVALEVKLEADLVRGLLEMEKRV